MKTFILFIALGLTAGEANAQTYNYGSNQNSHYVSGYERNNGTYVQPHYQTNSNNTTYDNYNTRGNYNPHTGTYSR
jgi:hypothetical protein